MLNQRPVVCDLLQDRPAEKPICICISSVEQLVAAKPPFSPLLWEFMRNVYPGGISCIVSKGDWLYKLGKQPWAAAVLALRKNVSPQCSPYLLVALM